MEKTNQHILFFSFIFLFFFFNNANLNGYASQSSGRLIPIEIVGPITVLVCFIYIYINKLRLFLPRWINKYIIIFFISLFIVSLFRIDILGSLRNFIAILITYSVVIAMSIILHKVPFLKVLNVFVYLVSFIILPFNLYIQQTKLGGFAIMPDRLAGEDTLRFGGALYHAHNGMLLGFTILLLLYLIFFKNKKSILNFTLLLALSIGVILTDCRSVWGGVIICSFLLFYKKVHSPYHKILYTISFCCIILFGTMALSKQGTTYSKTGEDVEFRQLIWYHSIKGIIGEPITGYGSVSYFQTNLNSREYISDSLNDTHNSFLDLFLQNGLPVSILLILIYIKIFKRFKSMKARQCLYILFVFWLFVPFFWGGIYKGTTGFITFFFPLSIFSIFLHPNFKIKKNESINHHRHPFLQPRTIHRTDNSQRFESNL